MKVNQGRLSLTLRKQRIIQMLYFLISLVVILGIIPLIISSAQLAKLIQNVWNLWLKIEIFDIDEIYNSD